MSVRVIPPGLQRAPPEPEELPDAEVIDWQPLRDAVTGRVGGTSRAEAMARLVGSNHPGVHRDLETVLANPAEPPRLRALAALNLAHLPSHPVEQILIDALATRDEQVLAAVMRALGRVGGEAALRAIVATKDATGVAANQARFAAALISHRLGIDGYDLPVPAPSDLVRVPEEAARPFRITPMVGADADHALRTLARERFGIEYDGDTLHEIRCADNRWLIAFNREIVTGGAIDRFRERKWFAAIVASWQEENRTWSARFLVLTAPEATGRVRVHVNRLTGEAAFFGFGEVTDAVAAFSVRAIDAPGAFPLVLEGRYLEGGRLEVKTALSALFIRKWRKPQQGSIDSTGRK